jgi:hypothetical protein
MIKNVVVNVKQTFAAPPVFLGCEQKMKRVDRNNASAGMVPDSGKWTVELMVTPVNDDGSKGKRENIAVTVESAVNPCGSLEEFDKVDVVGLQYNVMSGQSGAVQVFWRAKAVGVSAANAAVGVNGASAR